MAPRLDLSWFSNNQSWLSDAGKRARLSAAAREGLLLAAKLEQSGESVAAVAAELDRTEWKGVRPTALRWEDVLDDPEEVERARAEHGEYEHLVGAPVAEQRAPHWYPMKVYRRLARAREEIERLNSGRVRSCRCGLLHQIPTATGRPGRPPKAFNDACRQRAYRLRRKQGAKRNWHMARKRR